MFSFSSSFSGFMGCFYSKSSQEKTFAIRWFRAPFTGTIFSDPQLELSEARGRWMPEAGREYDWDHS